ncbi:MAG TPA: D-tyrosyl-tRNA(Tyr) deacylase [Planctomycetaceae bacterium]|nr:D-tyrosyl-tRNA(Tyr) deacylase [Planctomycetaceae bacterium]
MRACIQRVRQASVLVQGRVVGEIEKGLVVLLGIGHEDGRHEVQQLANKCCGLRIFEDEHGKMNRSLQEINGEMLVVSQFTLYGSCHKGRRPSFVAAAQPEAAEPLYESFVATVESFGIRVATGEFRTHMQVSLVNDGPVTLLIDTSQAF